MKKNTTIRQKKRAPAPERFDPQLFAKRVWELIERDGSSLRDIATEASIDAGVLSRMGSNSTLEPRLPTIWNLADYFDVSIDYLVGRTGGNILEDTVARNLWETYDRLSKRDRLTLVRFAQEMEHGKAST